MDPNVPYMVYVFCVVFSILPSIAVALRFQARHQKKNALFEDDWLVLVALVSPLIERLMVNNNEALRLPQSPQRRLSSLGWQQVAVRPLRRDSHGSPIYDHRYVIFQKVRQSLQRFKIIFQTHYCLDQDHIRSRPLPVMGPQPYKTIRSLPVSPYFRCSRTQVQHRIHNRHCSCDLLTYRILHHEHLPYYPVYQMWAMNPRGRKPIMKSTKMFLAQSYADVALDVVIIALPIPLCKFSLVGHAMSSADLCSLEITDGSQE